MTVTMEDVAKQAAVSIATVSRVLNNPELVNRETRERVLSAIQTLNYHVNITARNLRTQRTQNIAVVVPHLNNPLISDILEALEKTALAQGFTTQLCVTYGDIERAEKYATLLAERRRIDGAFAIAPTLMPEMMSLVHSVAENTPLLLGNHHLPDIPGILFDYHDAAYQVTQYLIHRGHTRIALLNLPPAHCFPAKMREEGFQQALDEASLPHELIFHPDIPDDYKANWHSAIEQLLAAQPTGVIAYDDRTAASIYRVCAERGLRIPHDISVIGCGDFPMAKMLHPTLTTLRFPTEKMGQLAFQTLFNYMNGASTRTTVYLPAELIQRNSATSPVK